MYLGEFSEIYERYRSRGDAPHTRRWRKSHKRLAESTMKLHRLCLRYLIAYFGESQSIDEITPLALESWLDSLAAGDLASVQQWKGREGKAPGEQGMRRIIRDAHAIFGWAKSNQFIEENPLADFQGRALASDPNHYVTPQELRAICAKATNPHWATLWMLCRLAGLRRGEALHLPWNGQDTDHDGRTQQVGVDWEQARLKICAIKTHHYREVPICPELFDVLTERFTSAQPGQNRVVDLSGNNMAKVICQAMDRAGVRRWAKPYQAMRSSCENDWKEAGIAEATYCNWLGHSAKVSREHYAAPTQAEFQRVTGDGA